MRRFYALGAALLGLLTLLGACGQEPDWQATAFEVTVSETGKRYPATATFSPDLVQTSAGSLGTEYERRDGLTHSSLDEVTFGLHQKPWPLYSNAQVIRRTVGAAQVEEHRFARSHSTLLWNEPVPGLGLWKSCLVRIRSAEVSAADRADAERVCASYEVEPAPAEES
ncbi:hypothetical protein [Deinococcus aquaedulcis]|uniref:hypothetical protein n=1 Tax=Deinococcus aquaedulcis TaxID=2840455 RepID=UPI001C83797D|nr:hypothetical protein [Deinococcus aquaedulcis]